jgi:hypothetical protein
MATMHSTAMRASAITAGAALLVGGALAPAQAGSGDFKIKGAQFGIHDFTNQKPGLNSGTIRLNFQPTWSTVQPSKGTWNWSQMDAAVNQARVWGFKDILFAFAGTPSWAAGPVPHPTYEILGAGSTAAPKDMGAWKEYVTRAVKRYKGKIKYWQTWNEATSWQFYQGTPSQMAKMTQILNKVVNKYGGGAKSLSASVQTHQPVYWARFAPAYFRAMDKRGWPADILSGHFYPTLRGGPDKRIAQINMFNAALNRTGAPKGKQRWDTEANFWTTVPGNPSAGRVTGDKAMTWIARNYLDSWRTGLRRSYWYTWETPGGNAQFPGIKTRTGDPGTTAYNVLAGWTIGAKYKGCTTSGALVSCHFTKGSSFDIAFTTSGKATAKFKGTKRICKVSGAKCTSATKSVSIGTMPTKIG